jgi:hypothetical protein
MNHTKSKRPDAYLPLTKLNPFLLLLINKFESFLVSLNIDFASIQKILLKKIKPHILQSRLGHHQQSSIVLNKRKTFQATPNFSHCIDSALAGEAGLVLMEEKWLGDLPEFAYISLAHSNLTLIIIFENIVFICSIMKEITMIKCLLLGIFIAKYQVDPVVKVFRDIITF